MSSPDLALANDAEVRGITISTHGIGRDWGTDAIVPTLENIRAVGANWVAIHPYARISADGTLRWSDIDPADPPAHIVRPIREAHRLGLRIYIKPHIAYWRSPFSWRGEIAFTSDEDWQRFWRSYREWIALLATVCREADGFVVGTELDRMLTFEEEWRGIIAEVRTAHRRAPDLRGQLDRLSPSAFLGCPRCHRHPGLFPPHRRSCVRRGGYPRWLGGADGGTAGL